MKFIIIICPFYFIYNEYSFENFKTLKIVCRKAYALIAEKICPYKLCVSPIITFCQWQPQITVFTCKQSMSLNVGVEITQGQSKHEQETHQSANPRGNVIPAQLSMQHFKSNSHACFPKKIQASGRPSNGQAWKRRWKLAVAGKSCGACKLAYILGCSCCTESVFLFPNSAVLPFSSLVGAEPETQNALTQRATAPQLPPPAINAQKEREKFAVSCARVSSFSDLEHTLAHSQSQNWSTLVNLPAKSRRSKLADNSRNENLRRFRLCDHS